MKFTEHTKTKSFRRMVLVSLVGLSLIEALGHMSNRVNYTYMDHHYGETEISFVPIEDWGLKINREGTSVYVFIEVHRWVPGLL